MEDLLSRGDRRRYSLATHELERRWKAVRERMAAKGIDFLVVQSQQRFAGGYFRWFTDIPGANFPISAVFPQEEDMTIIAHGSAAPIPPSNPPEWIYNLHPQVAVLSVAAGDESGLPDAPTAAAASIAATPYNRRIGRCT